MSYIPSHPPTPRKHRGRLPLLSQEQRQRLIEIATSSALHHRMPYFAIGELAGINVSEATIRRAFESEGYHRRIARIKPWLGEQAKKRRLQWCIEHQGWLVADWLRVIWTDEAAFRAVEIIGNTWVTRLSNEEYSPDCLMPKYHKRTSVIVWGSIVGGRTGSLVVWNSTERGTITGQPYLATRLGPFLSPHPRSQYRTHSLHGRQCPRSQRPHL